ncbi:MAG: hypothetical protein A3J54_01315 [Candidatus Ryanbacteria bacterium RIFCSPHIGHO2_02_FULL_45_13b]|uniref:Glycosyl transferase family 1 domain-containing protein n=1 Tax=Candidatus Ryanbacteria bacterium RIFCSPHIGHO2_02_FULL_45_13b TaxID=1802117 RepID=A0A1G2GAI7_9BACT|nr:MAG: hypothetical protein A3J54_01315 [Candidatus Ryanbacteria bacterium RIFCSPHIGHO2_02_FULL_45_13b]
MKVLMISSDPKILEDTEAKKRIEEYRMLVGELHPVVIAGRFNLCSFFRAYLEGSRVLRLHGSLDFLITAQDPAERWLIAWCLSKRFDVPLEVQVHTDLRSPYLLQESLKNRIRLHIAKFILLRATCIRVVSARIQHSLTGWLPQTASRVIVLPVYVDRERFQNMHHIEDQGGTFRFLMVSRLTKEKNIALAIDAFAEVYAEFPHIHLVIAGDGPERWRLEARVRKNNIGKGVVLFRGWQEDIMRLYEYAHCYLLTSNYEGYSRTVVEALSVGVPVIMTDVGVAGELVINEKTGLVVPVGGKKELVAAMKRIINDAYVRRTLSENGRLAIQTLPSKEVYLESYKNMWHTCGAKKI